MFKIPLTFTTLYYISLPSHNNLFMIILGTVPTNIACSTLRILPEAPCQGRGRVFYVKFNVQCVMVLFP